MTNLDWDKVNKRKQYMQEREDRIAELESRQRASFKYKVSGKAFPYKDLIKWNCNCQWEGKEKAWYTMEDPSDCIPAVEVQSGRVKIEEIEEL